MSHRNRFANVYTKRNGLGMFNIYLEAFSIISISILSIISGALLGWVAWSNRVWGYYWGATILWLISFFLFFVFLFFLKSKVPNLARDILNGPTTKMGHISVKWATEESTETGSGFKAHVAKHHIAVNGHRFSVSRRLYDWLSKDDEVVVHYWSRSDFLIEWLTVARIEKLGVK